MESILLKISIMLVPGLMAITCHEVSHGFIADRFGDRTARYMGRLTLNPLKHLDIIGTIMIFIIGIGWAKPVPVNFNNLNHPKRDMIWVAAAGPITNFTLAALSGLFLRVLISFAESVPQSSPLQIFLNPIALMLAFSVYINLVLAIFNLIPIPPLDGGRVMVGLLPYRQSLAYAGVEKYGMIGIILVVLFFPGILSSIISPPLYLGLNTLLGPKVMGYLVHSTSLERLGIFPF
jgi:Zn-dependent protease